MSLRRYLLVGYGVVLAIVLVGFSIIVAGVITLGGTPSQIVDQHYASILAADRMSQAVQAQQNAILRTLLSVNYDATHDLEQADQAFNTWLIRVRDNRVLLKEISIIAEIEKRYALLQALIANRARWAPIYPWEASVVDAFQNVIESCQQLATVNFNAMVEVSRSAHERVQFTVWMAAVAVAVILLFVGASRRRTGRELSQLRVLGARRRRTLVGASPLRGDCVVPYSRPRRPSPPETLRHFSAGRRVRSVRDDAQLAPRSVFGYR